MVNLDYIVLGLIYIILRLVLNLFMKLVIATFVLYLIQSYYSKVFANDHIFIDLVLIFYDHQ